MSTTTQELTQEEKRVKIAEVCGFLDIRIKESEADDNFGEKYLAGRHSKAGMFMEIPDYFASLDGMHEAEKALDLKQQALFCYFLAEPAENRETVWHLVDVQWLENPCTMWFPTFHATAPQRAEAFGKALNLW